MQVQKEQLEPTKLKVTVSASQAELDNIKQQVLEHLGQHVKIQGFREGKAPNNLIEKQVDAAQLQTEFLEQAVNRLYVDAVERENLRPVAQPDITIDKFVPFSTLEFSATVETVGEVKLADYKAIKLAPKKQEITAKDVDQVLDNLRARSAEKKEVKRAAKLDDEVVINFKGTDAKTKEAIQGADGSEYPLVLGSKTFIPGFEEELVGLKPGEKKSFVLTFPKDYGATSLQNRKVNFDVTVLKVQELVKPKLDDAFAKTAGPFKSLAELKADIKKQLIAEQQQQAQQAYDNELLEKIAEKSTVALPESLIEEEVSRMEDEEKRNLAYRGQTWQEHLKDEGVTEEEHRAQKRPMAELRVKVGLILGEIAKEENIMITPEELEIRIQLLKGQYPDPAMQAELDKDENRRDIHARMMTEKTIDKLRGYASPAK
ncbi:MAG TPA: trigger factor [Candidatus Saccharimonadales bacterium]|nr:trigger factor [Candidatus Saccharimonadales bacterium]